MMHTDSRIVNINEFVVQIESSNMEFLEFFSHKMLRGFVDNTLLNRVKINIRVDSYSTEYVGRENKPPSMWYENEYIFMKGNEVSGWVDTINKRAYFRAPHSVIGADTVLRFVLSILHARDSSALLLHSCGVISTEGNAYLFVGLSDAGKSTIARLSRPRVILSDEIVGLNRVSGEYYAYSTPFIGDAGNSNLFVRGKLKHIFFINQNDTDYAQKCGKIQAVSKMWKCNLCFEENVEICNRTFEKLKIAADTIPTSILNFTKTKKLWEIIDEMEA